MEDYNSNSPYFERPDENIRQTRYGTSVNKNKMATVSFVLGLVAMVSVFTFMVYPPLILGSIAVILAILSKGYEKKMCANARTGSLLGIGALVLDVAMVAAVIALIFSNGPFKQQLNETSKQVYGVTFDEMIQEMMQGEGDISLYLPEEISKSVSRPDDVV